jgi:hypothetical protein
MLRRRSDDQPAQTRQHPVAVHVLPELLGQRVLPALVLHADPVLRVTQVKVSDDPAVIIEDRALRNGGMPRGGEPDPDETFRR